MTSTPDVREPLPLIKNEFAELSIEMKVEDILEKYGLTKETTTRYIDAITRMNQTETADELEVSRDTVNRYKKAFDKMDDLERGQIIASLTTDKILRQALENAER